MFSAESRIPSAIFQGKYPIRSGNVLIPKSPGLTLDPIDIISWFLFFLLVFSTWNIVVNSFHHPRDGWFCPGTNVCLENIFMSASTIDEEALNSNMLISHRPAVRRSPSSSEGESGTQHLPSGVHHLYLRIFVLALTRAMWCWPQRHNPPSASRWKSKQTPPMEYYLHSSILAGCAFAAFC